MPSVYHTPDGRSTLTSALAWLEIGAQLIPCQPGGKHHVAGFGARSRRVTQPEEARFWFGDRLANLAVACGIGDVVAVDFDDWAGFARFADCHPDLCETLTEQSRRGVHLYYRCARAAQVRSGDTSHGCEVKAAGGAVLVAPSMVGGVRYTTVTLLPVMRCDDLPDRLHLSLLSEIYCPSSLEGKKADLVARCKQALDLLALARELQHRRGIGAAWKHSPDGAWWRSCCPFHGPEKNPSFMLNTARGFYLCRSCGERGDVLNLYQLVYGLPDVQSAIAEVAGRLA